VINPCEMEMVEMLMEKKKQVIINMFSSEFEIP